MSIGTLDKHDLQKILDSLPFAICHIDLDYRIIYGNRSYWKLIPVAKEHILGRPCYETVGEYVGDPTKTGKEKICHFCKLAEALTTKNQVVIERPFLNRILRVTTVPELDDNGKVIWFTEVIEDITERRLAKEALRKAHDQLERQVEERTSELGAANEELRIEIAEHLRTEELLTEKNSMLHTLINAIPDLVFFKDQNGRFLLGNTIMEKSTGLRQEEFVGKTDDELSPPEVAAACKKSDMEALKAGGPSRAEESYTDKDGKPRFLDVVKAPIYSSSGDLLGLVGIGRDITARRLMEEALSENEKRYRSLFEESPDGIVLVDTEGKILEFNGEAHRQLGYSREEFAQLSLTDIDPVEDPKEIRTKIGKILAMGKAAFDVKHRTKQGEIRDVYIINQTMTLAGRTVVHSIWHDITERKKQEETIRRSEELIRSILDTVDEGFTVIDRDYRIQTANKAYGRLHGCSGELVGQHCYKVSHKIDRPCYEEGEDCAPRRVFATGNPYSALHRHKDAGGNILYVETKAFPIKDESGTVISVIEAVHNITEKYLLEEERLKTQKLESIGVLAGGIAHDFNNLLQGVFGYISLAKLMADNREQSIAALDKAETALHQSVKLTSQLLTFSKGGKPNKKQLDLRPVIESSAKFVLSGSSADLRTEIPQGLWQAEADEGQLSQVIQNIVLNADQSMPIGGTIKVTAANMAKGDAALPSALATGNYVAIAIQDTGVGIQKQDLDRIYDPYFTTKEKGSGLGLATSYSIIRNHGGMIDVRTQQGKGTTFTIYLPATLSLVLVESAEPQQSLPQSRKAKILVMDDEEIIRDLGSKMLDMLGHDVEVAQHGREALETYQRAIAAGKPFDLVILDLTIRGGMGGLETLQHLRKTDPQVKAIVSSGYADNAATANYLSEGFKASLNKPYDVNALRAVLNKVLNPSPDTP